MHKQQGWPQAWEYCQAKPSFTRSELKLESVHQESPRSDIFRKRATKPYIYILNNDDNAWQFNRLQTPVSILWPTFPQTVWYWIVNCVKSHYYILLKKKKSIFINIYNSIHLYSDFLGTQSALHRRGISPHPPPVCSIHLDDARQPYGARTPTTHQLIGGEEKERWSQSVYGDY